MTDALTREVIREAIRADVRGRVDSIIDRLERQVSDLEEPEAMADALRAALAEVCDAVAEGLVAQMRENRRSRPGSDHR
jgi:hypothetical protein